MSKESVAFAEIVRRAYHATGNAIAATQTAPAILYCPKCKARKEHHDMRTGGVVYTTCNACGNETVITAGGNA